MKIKINVVCENLNKCTLLFSILLHFKPYGASLLNHTFNIDKRKEKMI